MLDRIQSLAGNVKRERPRAADPGAGAGGHRCSGISPAAAANASKAAAMACCWPLGSLAKMSSIRTRLRAVASSTTCRPAAVTETITDRRSAPGAMPAVQLLADQPIGHPPSCRRGYIERGGQVRHPLRSPGGQHDQHPVLSGRGVLGGRPQRRRADRNQRPARGQHGVHNGRFHQRLRLLCSSQYSHHATLGHTLIALRIQIARATYCRSGRGYGGALVSETPLPCYWPVRKPGVPAGKRCGRRLWRRACWRRRTI